MLMIILRLIFTIVNISKIVYQTGVEALRAILDLNVVRDGAKWFDASGALIALSSALNCFNQKNYLPILKNRISKLKKF